MKLDAVMQDGTRNMQEWHQGAASPVAPKYNSPSVAALLCAGVGGDCTNLRLGLGFPGHPMVKRLASSWEQWRNQTQGMTLNPRDGTARLWLGNTASVLQVQVLPAPFGIL